MPETRRMLHRLMPLGLILLFNFFPGITASGQVPDWLPAADQRRQAPIWVSSDHALGPDSTLKADVFLPHEYSNLQRELESLRQTVVAERSKGTTVAPDECLVWTMTAEHAVVEELAFDNLLEASTIALVGRLSDSKPGFFRGSVSTLGAIDVETVLKAPGTIDRDALVGNQALILWGRARLHIDGLDVCRQTLRGSAPLTRGARVLVFAHGIPSQQPLVVSPLDEEVFFELAYGGELSVPARLGQLEPKPSWHLVENWLEALQTNHMHDAPPSGSE